MHALSRDEWSRALESLPSYPFFCSPRYLDAWVHHHVPSARTRAFCVREHAEAWRLIALVEWQTSRFGTVALMATPEGGYGTAGVGRMRANWPNQAVLSLQHLRTDHVELVLQPGEDHALRANGAANIRYEAAWIIDLADGAQGWLERQVDKRVRRQLRICEAEGVETIRHGVDGLDDFYPLYVRSLGRDPGRRPFSKAFISDLLIDGRPGRASIYITRHRGRAIAAGMLLRGGADALAWIGCFDRTMAHLHGNLHRHYTVIRDLSTEGVAAYNLGAAPNLPEVARFKQKLGATARPYGVVTWGNPTLARLRRILCRAL
jgi:hypothetical protein